MTPKFCNGKRLQHLLAYSTRSTIPVFSIEAAGKCPVADTGRSREDQVVNPDVKTEPANSHELEQVIKDRAYSFWERDGRPDGKALDHWLHAETEIRRLCAMTSQENSPDRITAQGNNPDRATSQDNNPLDPENGVVYEPSAPRSHAGFQDRSDRRRR
jgi:hypothetical protein